MRRLGCKRGGLMQLYLMQIIIGAFIVVLFLMAIAQKADSRYVKQQIVEKQVALLLDSSSPGMTFTIFKVHSSGYINDLRIEKGRVHADVDGLMSIVGYSYFSRYHVSVREQNDKYIIEVRG